MAHQSSILPTVDDGAADTSQELLLPPFQADERDRRFEPFRRPAGGVHYPVTWATTPPRSTRLGMTTRRRRLTGGNDHGHDVCPWTVPIRNGLPIRGLQRRLTNTLLVGEAHRRGAAWGRAGGTVRRTTGGFSSAPAGRPDVCSPWRRTRTIPRGSSAASTGPRAIRLRRRTRAKAAGDD